MKRLIIWFAIGFLALTAWVLSGLTNRTGPFDDPPGPHPPEPGTLHVLFVGNSFTSANDLPTMIGELAKAAGESRALRVGRCLDDGFKLKDHWEQRDVIRALGEGRWEVVVLQEQSTIPSFDRERRAALMDAFARRLHEEIARAKARTLLYQTWGYRDGDRQNRPGDTYAAMQDRLERSYREVARELDATVVPVGEAWRIAHQRSPGLDLWAPDGRHPSRAGTYLAACTFYGVLYEKTPVGNPYAAGLSREEVQVLQQVAVTAIGR
jgi:hypothetical protein